FNPSTKINFTLPKESHVMLRVYNLIGREVAFLINETMTAGYYEFKFDASNLTSGLYIYKIEAGEFVSIKKMILMK
ncbi:MAG: T9SS type A sorting domain-containing protein, partial [Bacteroidetes bacterium]|nr:T9SS type A sorting domain-containing protein [Bacteroidota bacterium]